MKMLLSLLTGWALFCSLWAARAGVLELQNGPVLNGTYLGGTAGTVRFQTAKGTVLIPRDQALALTFTSSVAGAAIGATIGALRRGQTVTIKPGALVEFQSKQPVTIKRAW